MLRFRSASCSLLLLLAACTVTPEQKEAIRSYAEWKQSTGEWTEERAQEFVDDSQIDYGAIGMVLGGLLASVGVVRVARRRRKNHS